MQSLDVISVNIWQIIISLINLIILFLVVKKFLQKPVMRMLEKRQNDLDDKYKQAEMANFKAKEDENYWHDKIQSATKEAEDIISNAADSAKQTGDRIVTDAKEKADAIVRQAQSQAELEMEKAKEGIKKEIVEVSTLLTEKMLSREINKDDHKNMIDSFIEKLGDDDE